MKSQNKKSISGAPLTGIITLVLSLSLLVPFIGCGETKKRVFLPIADGLTGAASSSIDANGVPLPASSGGSAIQEVATKGPADIGGKLVPTINGTPICISVGVPAGCVNDSGSPLDLTKVVVKLVDSNGNVIATTSPDANGNYSFNVPELNNGNYRVLIESGNGLNYAYQDFNFVYNPTANGGTTVVGLPNMSAERLYLTSGPAEFVGSVVTPGFNGDVVIPSGALAGVTVTLKDSNGTILGTTTTDANGNYKFDKNNIASLANLSNGNYTVSVDGDSAPSNGRPFADQDLSVRFTFSGNDNSVTTTVPVSTANLAWQAATSSSATINLNVNNAAIPNDSTTVYTVTVKDSAGNVVATGTKTGSGAITLNGSNLSGGSYSVSITSPNSITANTSFNFIPDSTGGNKTVNLGTVNVVPKPSNVIGSIQGPGGIPNPVPGSVINFRPTTTQPPSSLAYLALAPGDDANTVQLRNLSNLWIREACTALAACNTACAAGGYQVSCVIANQGTGPWTYNTYSNKVYEVNGTQLTMTAVAGNWSYYISAPGYENTASSTMTLNGQNVTVPPITMTPSDKRSRIEGTVTVLDTLSSGTTNPYSNVSGIFAVMLGNNSTTGQPVAHITTTAGGAFKFDGNSKVVPLTGVTDLNGDGAVNDTDRVLYAIGAYASAPLLSSGAGVAGAGATNSVDSTGGFYNFKQSSYQVIFADPLGHILTTPKQADNSSVASNSYTTGTALLNLSPVYLPHQSRRNISGTITDAISTAAVSGATVTIGRMDASNQFQANVRRDCTAEAADAATCAMPTVRTPGSDQLVPTVTTNANGGYSINNLDPGNYVLRVSYNGIDTYIPVNVPTTGNTVANAQIVTSNGRGNLAGTVRTTTAGGTLVNFTGTYNLELVHPQFGTRPTAGVQPSSLVTGPTTFTNAPSFNVFSINTGSWKVRFISAGYVTVEALVNIQANATTNLDIITMVPGYQPPAAVSGRVLSAMTNTGVSGLTVRIRSGVNSTTGAYLDGVNPIVSGSDGSYSLPNIPAGNYTLEVSGAGYATTYRTVVSAGPDTPTNQNVLVSPILGTDEVRIILSWNATPRDLDSHLEFGSSPKQVVWNQKNRLCTDSTVENTKGSSAPLRNDICDLTLDYDIVTGYGPETVTAKGRFWTDAQVTKRGYSVYNWSNEAAMSTSGAVVRVFKSSGLVRSYAISGAQAGRWWQIFCLNQDKSITDVGQGSCTVNSFFNLDKN